MMNTWILLWPAVGAAIGHLTSSRSGLSETQCIAFGLFLGPFTVALLFVPADSPANERSTCSYCGQTIIRVARMCQHCGAILTTGP